MVTLPLSTESTTGSDAARRMPALFVGHGSPMNAIEENEFSRAWEAMAKSLPRPKAILCISAHWETAGTAVTAMAQPKTIHDFGGFPRELYDKQYPAPGSPELAEQVQQLVKKTRVAPDQNWGLDHGTWSVLCRMYPEAELPVVQLSLDHTQPPAWHYALGKELRKLREQGVLIVGSGNIVHNLYQVDFYNDGGYDWAAEFDGTIERLILAHDHESIIDYPKLGKAAALSIPTNEHFLPLLYALAQQYDDEPVSFFAEGLTLGSLSMRSVRIG
jgi:4,5-DOPA dioxygenase extradiol